MYSATVPVATVGKFGAAGGPTTVDESQMADAAHTEYAPAGHTSLRAGIQVHTRARAASPV